MKSYGRLTIEEFNIAQCKAKQDGRRTTVGALAAAKAVLVLNETQESSAALNEVAVRTVKNAVSLIWGIHSESIDDDRVAVLIEYPGNPVRVFTTKEKAKNIIKNEG